MMVMQIPLVSATETVMYGDANSNGTVEISDVTKIQKFIANKDTLTDVQQTAAKVSGNRTISIDDATLIQKYVAKTIDKFPVEEQKSDTLSVDYSTFYSKEQTEDEKLYTELFDTNSAVSVQINISDAELQKIQNDYEKYDAMGSKSPIYRKADSVIFTINGTKYEIDEVGVRMKGNTSRNDFFKDGQITDLIHLKLSFGETFDDETYYGSDAKVWNDKAERKARKNRTFATLEKMDMKWNSTYDSTYVRQEYNYEMFRDYGLLASHCVPAATTVGSTYCGVYSLCEPIDDIFLNKFLPANEQGGDLYKCGWTNNGASLTTNCSIGAEDEDTCSFYNYDIKTNKKTTTHSAINNLISTLNSSDLDNTKFENVVDKDYFVKFAAVSYFSGNPDDMRNCYNNYYLYFRPNGKSVFIPYDFDRCLGVTYGADPSGNGMTQVSPYSTKSILLHEAQKNPLYKYAITSTGAYKAEYTKQLDIIAKGKWLTYENFQPYYNAASTNYSSLTTPSKDFNNVVASSLTLSESNVNMSVKTFMSRITAYYSSLTGGNTDNTYTINLTLPSNTPEGDTLYLASSWNEWSPNDESYKFTRTSATTATLTLDISQHLGDTIQFKVTRGSWSNAECLANGSSYVGTGTNRNHELTTQSGASTILNIENWIDLYAA